MRVDRGQQRRGDGRELEGLDFVRGRVQQFMAGDAISIELWAMINLELWRREFLTGAIRMKAIAS